MATRKVSEASIANLKPFEPGNPGRPKGSRNKLGEAFTQALLADFEREGMAAIERTREEDPGAYLRVIASVVPKELKIEAEPLADLSDDDLERVIGVLRAAESSAAALRDDPRTAGSTH